MTTLDNNKPTRPFYKKKRYDFEEVHHKNGVRLDNRPENLELWARRQPPGQRVEDLLDWAEELLTLYRPERLNDNFGRDS